MIREEAEHIAVDRCTYFRESVYAEDMTGKEYASGGPLLAPDKDLPANLVSSLCADGKHRPALDIDVPCVVVPSSTPGHCHLYFPTIELEWPAYVGLLAALTSVGIIEDKYLDHSINDRQTLLRLPGVRKSEVRRREPREDDPF